MSLGEELPSYTYGHKADWGLIPEHMHAGLRRYIEHGIPPGHFLKAVLRNDLAEAVQRADMENRARLGDWVQFLYNYAPAGSWGSPERFTAWIKMGGLTGVQKHSATGIAMTAARRDHEPA